jgi:peptide/nickel transport system permease protein
MATRGRKWDFVWRRLLQTVPVIVFATFVVFALLKLVPGDIALTLAGDNATEQRIAEIRQLYGLDRPFLVQYGSWLWKAVHGNLSVSLLSGESVLDAILRSLPNTLLIVAIALLLAVLAGIPLGVLAASRPGSWLDRGLMTLSSLGVAVPNFWLAMILVSMLALERNWFPATGSVPLSENPVEALRHALLPGLALAAGGVAEVARQLRSSLAELLSSQQVRTLHAKGVSPSAILWKHGLKNVGVNLLTVIALLANRLLAATVVVEAVFAIPGMGSLIVHGAVHRDFPVVQGVVFTMVLIVIVINFTADALYRVVDPRVSS